MFNIGSWNIRGLNGHLKQKTVIDWTTKNNLDIYGLLETKIAAANMPAVESNLAPHPWKYISNVSASSPCRIMVGWNPIKLNLTCTHQSPQWLTCETTSLSTNASLKITFIYGFNTPAERTSLWLYICQESRMSTSIPWILMGDFNAIMRPADRHGGDTTWHHHLDDFNNCIQQAQLLQIPYSGLKYSWHNGQHGDHTIQKKLDWIFCNPCLLTNWPEAHSSFLPRHLSDHSAMTLNLRQESYQRHPPFKFLNVWADREDFSAIVNSSWQTHVQGNPMYRFTTKLRLLKAEFKNLHHQHTSHISNRVARAKADWNAAQLILDQRPASAEANSRERELAKAYMLLCKEEESFFKQKSRIQWLQLGDKNTKFFHNSLLHRQARNKIHSLMDDAGNIIQDQRELGRMATEYFQNLLSSDHGQLVEDVHLLFSNTISAPSSTALSLPITNEEIKAALFSIPDNKAAGPDGFNGLFFKKSWHIIGVDFTAAVRFFFSYNYMPRCVNATRIALVPKIENPSCMNDYRPISCCNVMYKCISKIIVGRLKTALTDMISPSQAAFIPGRQISDAILLTQNLMHNYHLNKGPARCALKVDLRKAFDTVSWEFILAGLHAIGIPQTMTSWIKQCISTAHYSISLNGELHGFFKASRGIRQGDPLSPYLFVLAMEGLAGILRHTTQQQGFKYHWRCKQNSITHLCFADDLMLFCHADTSSVAILKDSLNEFSSISGLKINLAKSSIYLTGIGDQLHSAIREQVGFQQSALPVRYLGVPLITTRLTHADCLPLVERIITRIKLWTSSSLTYAGRLQLIQSVLFSIQVYWSTMFILPCSTIRKLESILAGFLWKGTSLNSRGAKVAWHSLCFPKKEGGLGIKRLKVWNKAAVMKQIWNILGSKSSVWAAWVHSVLLRGRSFWEINIPSNPSWSWRKILQSRDWCRGWFQTCIGKGTTTSLWYDYWLPEGKRIIDIIPHRLLFSTGLAWTSKVSDIMHGDQWNFPASSPDLQVLWSSISFNPNPYMEDHCVWKGHHSGTFTVHSAWELIRESRPENCVHHLLWFKGHIPRQSFILWVASKKRLNTMDRLHSAGMLAHTTCILCAAHEESHNHLFFDCHYSNSVWRTICSKGNVQWPSLPWNQLLIWAANTYRKGKDIMHTIPRLMLSTTVYFLWHERNRRIFSQQFQSHHSTSRDILELIRTHIINMEHKRPIPDSVCHTWGIQQP